jgi:hypothetical protein
MTLTVICPVHGEHEYTIESNIDGHEGVWCQICWLQSLGPSLPYRRREEFQSMGEMNPMPDQGWETLPKNAPAE